MKLSTEISNQNNLSNQNFFSFRFPPTIRRPPAHLITTATTTGAVPEVMVQLLCPGQGPIHQVSGVLHKPTMLQTSAYFALKKHYLHRSNSSSVNNMHNSTLDSVILSISPTF
jgi:hypothetical protein